MNDFLDKHPTPADLFDRQQLEDLRTFRSAFNRPPRERYLRMTFRASPDVEYQLGIEWRADDSWTDIKTRAREAMPTILDAARPIDYAVEVERRLAIAFPERAFFIELWTGDDEDGWIQIYQPFGIPRNW